MMAGALILPVFTEFVYALVGKNIKTIYRASNFGITGLIILTIYTNLYAYDGGPFLAFNYWPIIGITSFIQILLYGINVFFSHRELLKVSISGNHHLKQQAKIIIIGTSLGYIGAASNFLLWFRIPFPPVLNVLIPIYVISVAYAITKHKLMDISVVISRAVAEALTLIFLGTGYLGLVWIYRSFISAQIGLPFLAMTILYGILVGQTHPRIRFFLQTTSDKLFLRGKYDYYKELAEVSSRLSKSLTLDNILDTLHKTFYEIIEVSKPRIYLPADFERPEVRPLLEIKELGFRGTDLVLPCRLEGKPVALIVLGPKLSEDPYTDEDLKLLKSLANQAAVALDRQRIYEEMLKNQKQLIQADKLSSMGRVAAGLAHEIKNPLAAVKGMIQTLDADSQDEEFMNDFRSVVPKEIERLNNLADNLTKLGKSTDLKFQPVKVNDVIEKALKLFGKQCQNQGIRVVSELAPASEITGDPEQLAQVFINLILNALQAMPNGGTLEIKSQKSKVKNNESIIIEITDTGHGIPQSDLKNIFEPFFSTKKEGSGLGLAVIYKIIKDHGGEIEVESEVNKGTRFRVALPSSN
jgi:signal transduction histidine kinase